MTNVGKAMRLRRIIRPETGRCVLLAVSHGTSTPEIFPQLEDTPAQVEAALVGGADCVLISSGMVCATCDVFARHPAKGYVAKLSATSYEAVPRETVISTVDRAARDGADAVGLLMQLTPQNEHDVIEMVAMVGEACDRLGMPYIVEAEWPGAYGSQPWFPEDVVAYLRRSCRLAQELGADVIKTNWPGSPEQYAEVIAPVSVPTVVAGGSKVGENELIEMIVGAIAAGAVGCSVGRNIFQADDPHDVTAQIVEAVHAPVALGAA
jgi:fructose-bisphosphate aldolase/2-amino-3,7-dideoxy-D-threo-hept-6-ulosonate synthase